MAQLADHLIGTVTFLGAAAGSGAGAMPDSAPLETPVVAFTGRNLR